MLDLVNQARSSVSYCGGADFPVQPAAALIWSCQLRDAAQIHSDDMATENFVNHVGSDGRYASDRIDTDYPLDLVGENLAAGDLTIAQVMEQWLSPSNECSNIAFSLYTHFGSAVATSTESDFSDYWTQVFAKLN